MTALKDHPSQTRSKVLVVGNSGSGKTTLLHTLANAGYKLRIMDFDNKLTPLRKWVKSEYIDNVQYEVLKDNVSQATAWVAAKRLLSNWGNLGAPTTWETDTVLVIDTLNYMFKAALNYAKTASGKTMTDNPSQPDRGTAIREVTIILNWLLSDAFKCNLVVNTHIRYQEDQEGIVRAYPYVDSPSLAPDIPTMFDEVIRVDVKSGGKTRVLRTASDHIMGLKVSNPDTPTEIAFDLAKLFEYIQDKPKQ